MRASLLYLFATLVGFCVTAAGQKTPLNLPVPPQATTSASNIPDSPSTYPTALKPHLDRLLQHDARELLQLSQSLQSDIESVNHGLLPRDTIKKLKRIEKLLSAPQKRVGSLTRNQRYNADDTPFLARFVMQTLLSLLFFFSCLLPGSVLAQSAISFPPGAREADKAQTQFEKEIPPPHATASRNPEQLQREADELAGLARSLPEDIRQLNRGVLSKDLTENLKRIEKLSKKLRTELK